jgi:hypothetical protein
MLVLGPKLSGMGACSVSLFRHERLQNDEYFPIAFSNLSMLRCQDNS